MYRESFGWTGIVGRTADALLTVLHTLMTMSDILLTVLDTLLTVFDTLLTGWMANYFHAYRIDHILGFFRIWEMPATATGGNTP